MINLSSELYVSDGVVAELRNGGVDNCKDSMQTVETIHAVV